MVVKGYKQSPQHIANVLLAKGINSPKELSEYYKKVSNEYWSKPESRLKASERTKALRAAGILPKQPMLGKHRSKEFKEYLAEIQRGRKASPEAKLNMSKAHKGIPLLDRRGPKHHYWKGGDSLTYTSDWNLLRIQVLDRDDYTCQACGKQPKRLLVHHITEWRIEHNNHLTNLISLCNSCHQKHHLGTLCLFVQALPKIVEGKLAG